MLPEDTEGVFVHTLRCVRAPGTLEVLRSDVGGLSTSLLVVRLVKFNLGVAEFVPRMSCNQPHVDDLESLPDSVVAHHNAGVEISFHYQAPLVVKVEGDPHLTEKGLPIPLP